MWYARVKIPGRALEALTSARVSIFVGRGSELGGRQYLWRWKRQWSRMVIGLADCSGAHCTIVAGAPEEKSLPPARLGLGRGGNLPPMVPQLLLRITEDKYILQR